MSDGPVWRRCASTTPQAVDRAAVLIVNGGEDPDQGKWLQLCLNKIREHTLWPNYHVYVWNNNLKDTWVAEFVTLFANVTLLTPDPAQPLSHFHAGPLQRLYERARAEESRYVVTLDSDAHPIRECWLTHLVTALDEETVISGVWRDELKTRIRPYIHASCLCTTVEFVEANHLRFDYIPPITDVVHDTLSSFTDRVRELGRSVHKLRRSNRNELHRLVGGIYGDLIYHHGAGSRPDVRFWDDARKPERHPENRSIRDQAAALLFCDYERYIAWLRGRPVPIPD